MRDGKAQPIFKRIQAHKSGPFDFEGIKFAQVISLFLQMNNESQKGHIFSIRVFDSIFRSFLRFTWAPFGV